MSIALRLTEVSNSMVGSVQALPKPQCDVANAITPAYNFFVGNALGLIPMIAALVIVVLAVFMLVRSSGTNARRAWGGIAGVFAVLLLIMVLPALLNAFGKAPC